MKWILCGKNDAAVECLAFLVERGDEVWTVGSPSDDGVDGWQASLRGAAQRLGVPFDQPARINDPAFVKRLAAFGARALLSVQFEQILHGALLERIGCPCLNLHFSLLPRHRGVAPIAWALLSGDSRAGATLHHIIEDIDAGDLIAQSAVPIAASDTARDLYDKVSREAVELFKRCYPFSMELLATRLAQNGADASYHRKRDLDFSNVRVDWRRPAAELQRWLRAMIFPPLQRPAAVLRGRRLAITGVGPSLGEAVAAPPGAVVACRPAGIEVAAADRSIHIVKMVAADEPRTSGASVLASIAAGDRFE
jgi:methionyl-tRNA formyltransferase